MFRRESLRAVLLILAWAFCGACPAFCQDALRRAIEVGGPIAALLALAGAALAGYLSGKSFDSYTGWGRFTHGAGMFFNREPFRRDRPTYAAASETQRPNFEDSFTARYHFLRSLMRPNGGEPPKWLPEMGAGELPEPFRTYFTQNPGKFQATVKLFALANQQRSRWELYKDRLAVSDAWANAVAGSFMDHDNAMKFQHFFPPEPQGPPEEWDFRGIRRAPVRFKSPRHAAELIKKTAFSFGATLVGVARLNPDWCYQGRLRGVGPCQYEKPAHWEYAIVIATPHEWDQLYAVPSYGSTYDAYARNRTIAGQLEIFLRELGYPARSHVPPAFYDIVLPPIAVDAGLGELGRNGLLVTPELGPNARLACVTTNLPMEADRPVDLGLARFCAKCKICARSCPSGAISFADEPPVVRGYRKWSNNPESCYRTWSTVANSSPKGCRICLAVCPFSKKNNWLHAASRALRPRDPTGLTARLLIWAQKRLYAYPQAKDFLPPPAGRNASFYEPPDWLRTEEWCDVDTEEAAR